LPRLGDVRRFGSLTGTGGGFRAGIGTDSGEIGDDGKVPVGAQRQSIDAPPRSTVLRCFRPDDDIYYLRFAPDPKAKPITMLHVPVF